MTEMTEIEQIKLEDIAPYDPDNPNAKAHVVDFIENRKRNWALFGLMANAEEIISTARLFQIKVLALCGYEWVPSRNPANHDACTTCLKIWGDMSV